MKHIRNFNQWKKINELVGADYYHLYPAIKKRLTSLMDSFEIEHTDVFLKSIKEAIVQTIIELYNIKDNDKNIKKIEDVFWLEPIQGPNKWSKKIFMNFKSKKAGVSDELPFLNLIDKKAFYEMELNYDDPEYGKKMKNRYSDSDLERGRVEMACCYRLIEEISKIFPKEVAEKETDKDVYSMIKPNIVSDDPEARNINIWLYEVENLENLFNTYLSNSDDQTYSKMEKLLNKAIELFKDYLEKKEYSNIPFEVFDYDRKTFHETIVSPWLSKFAKTFEKEITETNDKKEIVSALEDVAKWYQNN
jgi:hypothetical protein